MYLASLPIGPETRILHMAPERGLFMYLRDRTNDKNYVTADFSPKLYSFSKGCRHIDLCSLDRWETESFDLILHSHVLEHTACNIAYTMFHLDRMLAPGGKQVCVIPILQGFWDERFSGISDAERHNRFGQYDHVRRFGREDLQLSIGKIMRLPEKFDAEMDFGREALASHNVPERAWRGFTDSTVLIFNKGDYLLCTQNTIASLPSNQGAGNDAVDPQKKYKTIGIFSVALYLLILLVAGVLFLLF